MKTNILLLFQNHCGTFNDTFFTADSNFYFYEVLSRKKIQFHLCEKNTVSLNYSVQIKNRGWTKSSALLLMVQGVMVVRGNVQRLLIAMSQVCYNTRGKYKLFPMTFKLLKLLLIETAPEVLFIVNVQNSKVIKFN